MPCATGSAPGRSGAHVCDQPSWFWPAKDARTTVFPRRPRITEWRGLICHPEMASTATAALAAHIAVERPADLVQWRGVAGKAGSFASAATFGRRK